MPKWTEYTMKDTLADNDEVMLYDATGKANKRGLMSKFWDYVVDKMSTAVISKLETNNKTIIGAINALNSDSFKKISTEYIISNGLKKNAGKHPISSEKYTVIAAYNTYTSHIIVPFIASSDKTWRCYITKTDFTPVDNIDSYAITFLVAPIEFIGETRKK